MTEDGWGSYSPESDPDVHRWQQAQRERQERESAAAAGPAPELIRYRIVAQRTDPEHPGAVTLTHYAYAESVEQAVARVRQTHEKPGSVYGDQGLYRVVEAVEESWDSTVRQQEDARRRYLTTILENATTTVRGREPQAPDTDLVRRLDDFFTRAVTFPDPHGRGGRPRPHQATFGWTSERPYIEYASDPGRALALFLLAYLDHYGLELGAAVRTGDRSVASPVGEGRPSARGAEGGEAAPEIVERVMDICGQHYAAVTGTSPEQWDQESSREVVGIALRTVRIAERDAYPQALEAYLNERRARLERLWQRYGPDGMFAGEVVLIDLPGCFVLCERIDNSPLWLEGLWTQEGQEETALERFSDSWLYDTSDKDGGR
ncbi:hypothetical protein [Streptomyces brevispora]|uniref:Uncharacterized protein n=1 Tax=Streptomyces brevispora TaxID=887462 RepID=A0ABZ1GCL6_9ACTN|nr:hypothetical protein [Streptomyces brevispora]WSC11424.1 hypothetical protein OIE64_00005 [Streptomyces brevispora]WSC17687.1 hypothetical protein OIE64_36035 [Streptomyces brevispora]